MKTSNKMFLVGMIGVLLTFGFVFASCSQVFDGKETWSDKAIKLTLKSKSYKVEYDGKTYEGDASKTSSSGKSVYVWKSGGSGGVIVEKKKATAFSYIGNGISITAVNGLSRSVENGEISLDDIELIIEE